MSKDAVRPATFSALLLAGLSTLLAHPLRGAPNPALLLSTRVVASQSLKTAMDAQGNLYLAGAPLTTAAKCVMKLTQSGTVVYTTCFQATRFSSPYMYGCGIWIYDLAVDKNGSAYITGCTDAIDFPVVNPYSSRRDSAENGFVAKLDPLGRVVYATYFYSGHRRYSTTIAADDNGNAYVGGAGSDIPLVNPAATVGSGYLAKFDPAGKTLLYSTLLPDRPTAIAVDRAGAAHIVSSPGYRPVSLVRPLQACDDRQRDALIIKLTPSGSYDYVTCLGGSRSDGANDIAVDAAGGAYVVGTTTSSDFPTRHPLNIRPRVGAVWRSRDAGRTWRDLPLAIASSRVTSLVPGTGQPGRWYAGTTDGAFKSIDDGNTWRQLPLPRDSVYGPGSTHVVADRHSSTTLYASTEKGLYKSIDDGEHWLAIGAGMPHHGASSYLHSIAVAPDDPRILYAVAQWGFWRSLDGGATWNFSHTGLGAAPHVQYLSVSDVTAALYATVVGNYGTRVFVSRDRGATWKPTTIEMRDLSTQTLVAAGQSVYFGAGAGPRTGNAANAVLFRSDDGGANWQSIGDGLPESGLQRLVVAPNDPNFVYATARERLYVSGDRGAHFTQLPGMSWSDWESPAVAVDPRDRLHVLVGRSGSSDAFVAKIAPGGASLDYATYLGGGGNDSADGIAIDDFGRAVVFGSTSSRDFPNVAALQNYHGDTDAFIAVLDGSGSVLLFSSLFGSPGADTIHSAFVLGRRILFAGHTPDVGSMFPGSGATGFGSFLGLLDLSYGAPASGRVP